MDLETFPPKSEGIQSIEHFIPLLSHDSQPQPPTQHLYHASSSSLMDSLDIEAATEEAVWKLRKVVSLLNKSMIDHAQFWWTRIMSLDQNLTNPHQGLRFPSSMWWIPDGLLSRYIVPMPLQCMPPLSSKVEKTEPSSTMIHFAATSILSSLTTWQNDNVHINSVFRVPNLTHMVLWDGAFENMM